VGFRTWLLGRGILPWMTAPSAASRYVLHGEIASGGMATVHYGMLVSPTGFGRVVAIKRIRPDLAGDREIHAMLADEARMAARVTHRNVVPILDVVSRDDELMLVMEYVPGEALSFILARVDERGETILPGIAARIVQDVLRGLHAAHEARDAHGELLELVHRDMSPHNVLVDEHGVSRVLDFGVAKAKGRSRTTEAGGLKGKVGYMAPEQVHGETSRQSDVFAVGIVLWEMLTGTRLFEGKTRGEILARVLSTRVERPSRRGVNVTEALEDVVMRALQREPSERFATALEMATALDAAASGTSNADVAAWVNGLVGDRLEHRREEVRAIERSCAAARPKPRAALPARARTFLRRPVVWAMAGLTLAAFAVLLPVVARHRPDVAETSSLPAPPPPDDTDDTDDAVDTHNTVAMPAFDVTDPPPSSSTPRPRRAGPIRAPRPRASARPGCNPAYVVDSAGHIAWKRECF
jgi:eukaryotic-like serine/threonine-protein kinase